MPKLMPLHRYRQDFHLFAAARWNETVNFSTNLYLGLMSAIYGELAFGNLRRVVLNLPPRSFKTTMMATFIVWLLGRSPKTRIMVITGSQGLAEDIATTIRELAADSWYRSIFPGFRVAKGRGALTDFATTEGGRVLLRSIDSRIAGRGADWLFVDDIVDIGDAGNEERLEHVNQLFETAALSRLNNRANARVVVVGHRVADNDLSAHLLVHGGFKHFALPLVAPRETTYEVGNFTWPRKRGHVLNDGFTAAEITRMQRSMVSPDYQTLYQQRVGGASTAISASSFRYYDSLPQPHGPLVVSIDAALLPGERNSYTVAQAWVRADGVDHLVDQIRERAHPREVARSLLRFCGQHRPALVLIEETAGGPFLADDLEDAGWVVRRVRPGRRSKAERAIPHLAAIRRGLVALPRRADVTPVFVEEAVNFGRGTTDQIDSMSQYRDFMSTSPELPQPQPQQSGLGARAQQGRLAVRKLDFAAAAFGRARVPEAGFPAGLARGSLIRRRW